jgi:hypothetical protein
MLERALQQPSIGVDPLSRMPRRSASSAPKELTASARRGRDATRTCLTAAVEAVVEAAVSSLDSKKYCLLSDKMAEGTFAK